MLWREAIVRGADAQLRAVRDVFFGGAVPPPEDAGPDGEPVALVEVERDETEAPSRLGRVLRPFRLS